MKEIKRAVLFLITLSLLTGILYPLAVTVLARIIFPHQAAGSLMHKADGACIGSSLIGQPFSDPKYFWSRPSATVDFPYNPIASGGSNWGSTNPDLLNRIKTDVTALRSAEINGSIPADLVTASASGLDPHISLESAIIQIPRIAKERLVSEEKIHQLVQSYIENRQFGFMGNRRVNVLKLNLALDNL